MQAQSTEPVAYNVGTETTPKEYDRPAIVKQALAAIEAEMRKPGATMDSPMAVRDLIRLHAAQQEDLYVERFSVLWLDAMNRLIAMEELFRGTLNQTSVYPRELVRRAMRLNAASCILTHNHPSGSTQPSRADEHITTSIKSTLSLVDVRVLDHFITNGTEIRSMAEMGLI